MQPRPWATPRCWATAEGTRGVAGEGEAGGPHRTNKHGNQAQLPFSGSQEAGGSESRAASGTEGEN